MEKEIGGVPYLAWRFSNNNNGDMPGLSECTQVIYHCQAATKPDDKTKKLYSLDEIWDLVNIEGIKVLKDVIVFLSGVAAGNKLAPAVSENQKKSSPIVGPQANPQ